ncbi:MAG: hypothetical protein GY838_19590 [bacterium]|nr:hypothetical protein [bacterium]
MRRPSRAQTRPAVGVFLLIFALDALALIAVPGPSLAQPPGTGAGVARSTPRPAVLATGWGNSSGAQQQLTLAPVETETAYRVLIDLADPATVRRAWEVGLDSAQLGRHEYELSEDLFPRLKSAAFPILSVSGVTTHRFSYRGDVFARPDPLHREESAGGPQITKATGQLTISSGTVNDEIPDLESMWRWVQVGSGSSAPAGARTTLLEYRMRLHNDSAPSNFYCGDYEIYLSSTASGGAAPALLVYDNLGGRSDDGFDDDDEDDSDIYLNWRNTNSFNDQDPNQRWYVYIADTVGGDQGYLQYVEFRVQWSTDSQVDLDAVDVYFRTAAASGGTRVDNPAAGQQLYPHVSYEIDSPNPVTGKIWQMKLDGNVLCSSTTTLDEGSWVGWCNSPWTATAGGHTLRGELNPDGTIDESNVNNNNINRNFTVVGGPGCTADQTTLCLNQERFRVEVDWRDFQGNTGSGQVVPFGSDDSGLFWFFDADNWEMLVKVLNGCGVNNYFWVFSAATTNVEYVLRVTDTETSTVRQYTNPLGTSAPAITDATAFATCP